jgi:hypothetical protein
MSTFEKRFVREVIPFYAWMRHSTLATFRLPIQSPMRAAMIYHLGKMAADPEVQGEVARLSGTRMPLGGGLFFDTGSFSPLAEMTGDTITPFDPRRLGSALSPAIRVPLQMATGVDPRTWAQSTRPTDTFERGLYGGRDATPTWSRLASDPMGALKETAWQLSRVTPQTRGVADILYGNEARYAGTGYPIEDLPKNPNMTWNRSLLRGLQLPGLYTINIAEVQRQAAERAAAGKG